MTDTNERILESPLLSRLGVRHGFSTRNGGVSEGPFATLNLAVAPGDVPDAVAENLRRFADAIGVERRALYQISQVHGVRVREVAPSDDIGAVVREQGDALVARHGGDGHAAAPAVGVRVADCVPVLLFDDATGDVAAVHAGWRGVAAGIVGAALAALTNNVPPSRVHAAIGPCIGACCFEVGEDVADAIAVAAPAEGVVVERPGTRPHVDLRLAVRSQLAAFGVVPARVDDVPGCTCCERARFFSFRRDGERSGRHLAAIAPVAR